MAAELELKLAIGPGDVAGTIARLRRHPALAAVRKGRWRSSRVVSTYLDTPDWQLASAGLALRLRRDGLRWLQTLKGPPLADAGGALHARSEYEWPIAGPVLDPARLATTPWRALLGSVIAKGTLAPRFTTDFERETLALQFDDGSRAQLCIDLGEIRTPGKQRRAAKAGQRRVPVSEIEIELVAGDAARLFGVARSLAADLPLQVSVSSKAVRGQALARGKPDGYAVPLRATSIALAADVSTANALRSIAIECLHQIAANAAGLRADTDPEWVHQMRIGTRRLRSCLALVARTAPSTAAGPLVAEVKWLATVLGVARDWDVFATETMPQFAACGAAERPARMDLAPMHARIAAHRAAAATAARDAVASKRFQLLVLAAGEWCATPAARPPDLPGDATPMITAKRFAERLLARRHRRLIRGMAAGAGGTADERHRLRIAAKKLRYAAEFFAPLLDGKRAAAYVRTLAGLQQILGNGNDAATAVRLAADIASGSDAAAAALRGWTASRAAAPLPGLEAALRRLARAKRFWTHD